MELDESCSLLDPSALALETGFERFANGIVHVACRTDMQHCTGEMFEWWYRFRPDTRQYKWWHPVDHIYSGWLNTTEGTHIGSVHQITEEFSGIAAKDLSIQLLDPTTFYDRHDYEAAKRSGAISAVVFGRTALGHSPTPDDAGNFLGSRVIHVARDTPWGMVLRSHFFMGQDLPGLGHSPSEISDLFPDDFAKGMLQHCYNEFIFLARILPPLYAAENAADTPVTLPW